MQDSASKEEELFEAARRLDSEEERSAYLSTACAGDEALRQRVEKLLNAANQDSFFDRSAGFPFGNRTLPPESSVTDLETLAASDATADGPDLKWRGPRRNEIPRFVEGAPDMEAETAALLHGRLKIIATVLFVMMLLFVLMERKRPVAQLGWPQFLNVAVVIFSVLILWLRRHWSLRALRVLEGTMMGSFIFSGMMLQNQSIVHYFEQGDAPTVTAIKMMTFFRPAMFILIYGTFIPHRWQTAAVIFSLAALVPIVNVYRLAATNPDLALMLQADKFGLLMPLPIFAALTATVAAHVIHSIRSEAFRARRFAQYQLGERIGAGGMGEVYRAEHLMLKRPCAIKFIAPGAGNHEVALLRFEREVRAAAQLTHWNTIEIYDFGRTDDGRFYYVMELLPGRNLNEIIRTHGPLPPARVIHVLQQVCAALAEAHAAGLIHRDIKPANVHITRRGGVWDVVKLLDFGLVKLSQIHPQSDTDVSRPGEVMGSPAYMSPEQADTPDQVDARTDIYSIGIMAYQMLTGQPPFTAESPVQLLIAHARDTPPPPSEHHPDIPADLEAIVIRCLAKDRDERHQNVDELAAALAGCADAGQWTSADAGQWWQTHDARAVREADQTETPKA